MKRKLGIMDSIEDFETSNTFRLLNKNLESLRDNETIISTATSTLLPTTTSGLLPIDVDNNSLKSCLAETMLSDSFWADIIEMTKETYNAIELPSSTCKIYNNGDTDITNSYIRNYIDNTNTTDRSTNSDTASDLLDDQSRSSTPSLNDDISNQQNLIFEYNEPKLTYDDVIERFQDEALVITEALSPFRIIYVNDAWTEVCGFKSDEAIGKSLSFIQGPYTDLSIINNMMEYVKAGVGCTADLINYQKNGKAFHNRLRISHIYDKQCTAIVSCYGILKFEGYYQNRHDSSIHDQGVIE